MVATARGGDLKTHKERAWAYFSRIRDRVRNDGDPRVRRAYDRYVRVTILLELLRRERKL